MCLHSQWFVTQINIYTFSGGIIGKFSINISDDFTVKTDINVDGRPYEYKIEEEKKYQTSDDDDRSEYFVCLVSFELFTEFEIPGRIKQSLDLQ